MSSQKNVNFGDGINEPDYTILPKSDLVLEMEADKILSEVSNELESKEEV